MGLLTVKGWGQATATYTIASKTAVTTSGTAPSGSSATYSQTYAATVSQMTSGNSTTLTLTGYAGYKITNIVLSMGSNVNAGAGSLSVVAGTTTIASVPTATKFNDPAWNGAWSGSPTYVNVTKTPSAYDITTGQNVVITILASTNSLYIQSYSITYVPSGKTVTFDANGGTGTMTNQTASSATNLTSNAFTRTGYTFAGWATTAGGVVAYADGASYPFTADATLYAQWTLNVTPTLSASFLPAFGSKCIGSTYGPNSFNITGTSLTTDDVTVVALPGYTYSTTWGGTYTPSLRLTQAGGAYSQNIFVKFNPTAASAYTGNIVVGGGGATDINVAASGTGINTAPTITTPTSTAITTTTATLGGNITSIGCSNATVEGIEWSTTNNFTNGTGTQVSASGSFGTGVYTQAVSGLPSGTTIYFKAYCTNGGGTVYTPQSSFVTLKTEPTNQPTAFACGTTTTTTIPLTWTDATGASVPDGYLIKWSSVSYAAITDPTDGSTANGASATTVNQGVQAATISSLSAGTTYYFKIWSYTNSGANIDYKNTTTAQTSCITLTAPWEDFEIGSKASYAIGNVACRAGSWSFDDAVLGSLVGDRYNGTQGARIRNGSISMNFDLTGGVGTVTLLHGVYGSDGNSTWQLQASTNGGSTWTAYTSSSITSSSTTLTSQNFTLNLSGNVRFRIIKTISNTERFNIDDIYVTPFNGPLMSVLQAATPIASSTGSYDFGNQQVSTSSSAVTFTVKNTGTATLNLSGSPKIAISGHTTDFTINETATTSAVAASGGTTTYTITFNPTTTGTRSATISIANDDPANNPYTYTITGNGTYATTSTITENSTTYNNGSPSTKIDYTTYQTTPGIGNPITGTIQVFKFNINDLGSDGQSTILTALNLTVKDPSGTNQISQIRHAVLATTSNSIRAVATITGTELQFSGLAAADFTATDGNSLTYILRVSYQSTGGVIVDNTKFVFKVSSATANPSGSIFAAADAGGATSDVTGGSDNKNRIDVAADRIRFTTQPVDQSVSVNLATFTIKAVDVNSNIDLDANKSVVLTTSGTGMTSSSPYSLTSGVLNISDVQFSTAPQTGITLTATTTGYTDNDDVSATFNISNVATGTYRTTSGGTWPSGTATWERYNGSTWNAATPASSTTDLLIIRHAITSRAAFAAPSPNYTSMTVENGGSFNDAHNSTFGMLLVKNGGSFTLSDPGVDVASTGTLTVDSGGTVVINSSTFNHADCFFCGTENFKAGSTVEIQQYDNNSSPGEDDLIESTNPISLNADGYYFGNLFINMTFSLPANNKAMTLVGITGTQKLCKNNLTIANQEATEQIQMTNVSANVEVGGNLLITKNKFGFGTLSGSTVTHTIKGNITVNGATAIMEMNSTNSGSASVNVNLEGDLIGIAGTMKSTDDGCSIAFTNTSLQNIDIVDAVPFNNINVYVRNLAKVQLLNNDFKLNSNSTFTVEDGGTFNFSWAADGTTPLKISNGASGSNLFNSNEGSTLKITSPQGIVKTVANSGNVQLSVSNKNFNQTATFHYIGKVNQVTGDGISTGSSAKVIICDLIDNATQLSFTNSTGITSTNTISATGGKLDIRSGQVIESTTAYITGSTGTLYMSPGTLYYIPTGYSSLTTEVGSSGGTYIPRMLGSAFPYILNGGTIELAGSGASHVFQTLRGSRTYKNIKFSGTNSTYSYPTLTDYKNLSSNAVIDSALIITNGAIVDCIDNSGGAVSFTGAGGLTMSGTDSRLRMKLLNTTLPELLGTARAYSLTGGTVEWYGTSTSQTHSLRGTYGSPSTTINYYNIDINANGANIGAGGANVKAGAGFGVAGVMNVNPPACFQLASGFTISDAGTSTFELKPGATLKYGGTIAASGASGNIQTDTRVFPTTASYGFVGNVSPQDPGTGLPSKMVNMYLDKATVGNLVTITKDEEITDTLVFYTGVLETNSNTLSVTNLATSAIKGAAATGTDKYVQGRLQRKVDGSSAYNFPVGHSSEGAQPFTITPAGASGSTILGFMETYGSSPLKPVAYCDLETKTAPGQQIGQGTAGADGALDQITFNIKSPLQWDVTNPSGGVSSYDITVGANGGQDISPVSSAGGTPIRYLMKNGEPGNTGFATGTGGTDFPTVGFIACPNQYTLSGMTSFSKFTLDGASPSGTQLPVKLTYFTARRVENRSQLDWATSLEIDNDRFEVERSKDAVSFELMGIVKGAGNTTAPQSYRLFDEAPLQGWNYYRLKQVDFDGKFEYSNTVALYFDGENFSIVLYPNPAKGQFTLESFGEAKIFDAAIFNVLGQEIRKVKTGEVNRVEDLAAGNYFIKIKADNKIITKKLIVQ